MAAPSLRCGPPRPTQSSGNAPSSPVEDDQQGCTQAVLGEGFSKVSVGNPSQKLRKRCMFRHMSLKTASGSGSEMGLLLAAWRRRGGAWRWLRPPCPRLFPALTLSLEVLWGPSLPLPGRGVDQETPEGGRGLWGGTDCNASEGGTDLDQLPPVLPSSRNGSDRRAFQRETWRCYQGPPGDVREKIPRALKAHFLQLSGRKRKALVMSKEWNHTDKIKF